MAIFKETLFNDGEGLVSADLNNIQRHMRSMIQDGFLGRQRRTSDNTLSSSSGCFGAGVGGSIRATGAALQTGNQGGTIATQHTTGDPTGSDPLTLMYYIVADEILTTHGAAHATLERWDVIQVKLDHLEATATSRDFKDATTGAVTSTTPNKQRQVRLTYNTVVGTAAAVGTAVEPVTTTGFVKWAAVLIPPTHAAVFVPLAHLRDYRIPTDNFSTGIIPASSFTRVGGFLTEHSLGRQSAAAFENMTAMLPMSSAGRVMRLGITGKISAGGGISLYRLTAHLGTSATLTALGGAIFGTLAAFGRLPIINGGTLQVTAPGNAPVWGRGGEGGPDANISDTQLLMISATSGAAGDYINFVDYQIAGP